MTNIEFGKEIQKLSEYILKKYWSQDQNSKSATKEILFKGEAEIVEILKEHER